MGKVAILFTVTEENVESFREELEFALDVDDLVDERYQLLMFY